MMLTEYKSTPYGRIRTDYTSKRHPSSQHPTEEERITLESDWYEKFGGQYPELDRGTSPTAFSSRPDSSSGTTSKAVTQLPSSRNSSQQSYLAAPSMPSPSPTLSSTSNSLLYRNPYLMFGGTASNSTPATNPVVQPYTQSSTRPKVQPPPRFKRKELWTDEEWDRHWTWTLLTSEDMQEKFTPADWDDFWTDKPSKVPVDLATFLGGMPGRFGTVWNSRNNPYAGEPTSDSVCWADDDDSDQETPFIKLPKTRRETVVGYGSVW